MSTNLKYVYKVSVIIYKSNQMKSLIVTYLEFLTLMDIYNEYITIMYNENYTCEFLYSNWIIIFSTLFNISYVAAMV